MSQQVSGAAPESAAVALPGRIAGIDAARALAIFGMFTVHLGVGAIGLLDVDAAEVVHGLARGRSSALFAFLAGVSLALMTGRGAPLSGAPLHRVSARILVRVVALALLGGVVDLLGAPVAVILTYYAGFFLLALPLLKLRAPALAAAAAAVGLLGPQVSFLLRDELRLASAHASSIDGLADFLLTGYYPACTFMAFVIAGLAVGRLELTAPRVRLRLAGVGAGLVALGYGASWLLVYPLGGLQRLVAEAGPDLTGVDPALLGPIRAWMVEQIYDLHGQVPTDSVWWLLVASPHSGTSFEIAGALGVALLVLVGCMALTDVAGAVLYPLAAAGAMALTLYVGHIVAMALFGMSFLDVAPFRLELFVIASLTFATLWRLLVGRGPLEQGLTWLAGLGPLLLPRAEGLPRR
ncbi:heparan-alpha-glucosaminide N-acetyltransferase domain-containing protein [Nocardiopsis rhodophaea]|uniref:heparan-alpha-glucosaminide N-acetyltransferase domain-containing protein n=1 Tax=Nocardiopsis rhodophaea TaxID=280238 RepID=UPI0031D810E2